MPNRIRISDGARDWTLEVDGSMVRFVSDDRTVRVIRDGDDRFRTVEAGSITRGVAVRHGHVVWVSIDGVVFELGVGRVGSRQDSTEDDALAAPMPATVVRITVQPGQAVSRGDLLISLEAMKMELAIRAPRDGVIAAVHCREGELVSPGHPLLEMHGPTP